mgnify:CR=1 FL=1
MENSIADYSAHLCPLAIRFRSGFIWKVFYWRKDYSNRRGHTRSKFYLGVCRCLFRPVAISRLTHNDRREGRNEDCFSVFSRLVLFKWTSDKVVCQVRPSMWQRPTLRNSWHARLYMAFFWVHLLAVIHLVVPKDSQWIGRKNKNYTQHQLCQIGSHQLRKVRVYLSAPVLSDRAKQLKPYFS